MERAGSRVAAAVLVLASQAVVGCDTGSREAPSAKVVSAVSQRLQRSDLTGVELQHATALASTYAAALVADHVELAGLKVRGIFPVFDEASPVPIGAMARLVLPAAIPTVEMELIRSRGEVPERLRTEITDLRSLDAIFEFQGDEVIFLGISPLASDAADPANATQAHPVDPELHRDPAFGEDE